MNNKGVWLLLVVIVAAISGACSAAGLTINVSSPIQGLSYNENSILLNISVDGNYSKVWYNHVIFPDTGGYFYTQNKSYSNPELLEYVNGFSILFVYANDSQGNLFSKSVNFRVNHTCTPNWVLNSNWSECDSNNIRYLDYYDQNNCGKTPPTSIAKSCDEDSDGYNDVVDCNDNDPSIHPGMTETCNAIDDNCDGQIDEGCLSPKPEWKLSFHMMYSFDKINDIEETDDQGFVAVGSNQNHIWLMRMDQNGNVIWSTSFNVSVYDFAYSVQETKDHGFVLSANSVDRYFAPMQGTVTVIKTDSSGNIQWKRSFINRFHDSLETMCPFTASFENAMSIKETQEGNLIVGAWTQRNPFYFNSDYDFWLMKLDPNGNLMLNKTYDNHGGFDILNNLVLTSDGNILLSGLSRVNEQNQVHTYAWIIKTDQEGNILWNSTIVGNPDYQLSSAFGIHETDDHGILFSSDKSVIKLNDKGIYQWGKLISDPGIGPSRRFALAKDFDGGSLLGIEKSLFKLDSSGNTIWKLNYKITNISRVKVNSDNSIILLGQEFSVDYNNVPFYFNIIQKFAPSCTPDFVPTDVWSPCRSDDKQYQNYTDLNSCGITHAPLTMNCDYCTPDWHISGYGSCQPGEIKYANRFNDSNSCFAMTGLSSDQFSGNISQYYAYCDYNKDNIVGNLPDIHASFSNLTFYIDNMSGMNSGKPNGTHNVRFGRLNQTIVEFNYNFSAEPLWIHNITIEVNPSDSAYGFIRLTDIKLSSPSDTKTVYMDHISGNRICIKDLDISSISEITGDCKGANEIVIICDGTSQSSYTCELIGTSTYKVQGLKHSAIREFTYTPPVTPPSGGGGSSGGSTPRRSSGGGGGGGPSIIVNTTLNSSVPVNNSVNMTNANVSMDKVKTQNATSVTVQKDISGKNSTILPETNPLLREARLESNKSSAITGKAAKVTSTSGNDQSLKWGLAVFLMIIVATLAIRNKKKLMRRR